METRQRALKKRRTEEDTENELIQKQAFHKSFEIGPRDIEVRQETKCSVTIQDTFIKQEIHTEMEANDEFQSEPNEIKLEIGVDEKKFVVINEEVVILNNDGDNDAQSCNQIVEEVDSFNRQANWNDLQITGEPQLSIVKDVQHQNTTLEKVLPLFMDLLALSNILLCRRVNKRWRQIVDGFLQSKISRELFDNETYLNKMKKFPLEDLSRQKYLRIKYAYQFQSNFNTFTEKMKNSTSLDLSPFVGGAEVSFVSKPFFRGHLKVLEVGRHLRQLEKFIEIFGKYVSYLKIDATGINLCYAYRMGFQRTLKNCLARCPNLKSLAIQTKCSNMKRFDTMSLQICEPFENSSVPQNLDFILLNLYTDYKAPNLSQILMTKLVEPFCAAQLKKLGIIWNKSLKLEMPQLKELTLIMKNKELEGDAAKKLQKHWLKAPVEKLYLFATEDLYVMYNSVDLLNIVPTVRYLKLDYAIWVRFNFKCPVNFQLDNVHTLELTKFSGHRAIPSDFIRMFPNLRYLKLSTMLHKDMVPVNTCNSLVPQKLFGRGAMSIYRTQMWKTATNLETVVILCHNHKCRLIETCFSWPTDLCPIENVVGTREGYRLHCEELTARKDK